MIANWKRGSIAGVSIIQISRLRRARSGIGSGVLVSKLFGRQQPPVFGSKLTLTTSRVM